jgi:hypothetical protein
LSHCPIYANTLAHSSKVEITKNKFYSNELRKKYVKSLLKWMLPCGEEKLEKEQLFVNSFCGERCVYTRDFVRGKNAIKRNTDNYVL